MNENDSNYWGNLFATWILACNDEQPIIFYKSLAERLGCDNTDDLREMVKNHRELFRPMKEATLNKYKKHYMDKPHCFPKVLNTNNESVEDAWRHITTEDAFTSQFRRKPDEKKSSDDLRDWGVNYIQKRWDMVVKTREERRFIRSAIYIPVASIIVTIMLAVMAILYK
jgi:hypothetical protein